LYKSEKKTIIYVLGLYLSSTLLLIATLFTSYYFYKQEQLINTEKEILKSYASKIEDKLSKIHENFNDRYQYPRTNEYKSAIYDVDKNLIFSTLNTEVELGDEEFFFHDSYSYFISPLKPYYLGAAYTLIQKRTKEVNILSDILIHAIIITLITIVTSFFLVKPVLSPLRKNLRLLDDFIKDTTHELNTPITTILANIETLDDSNCDDKSLKKLQRIKIASMSISNLYQDLVYLLLNHQTSSQNETLNLSEILQERVQYFSQMASVKKITIKVSLKEDVQFFADKLKIQRLFDNILSNAIKYTQASTTIKVKIDENYISISDEGKGMSEYEISKIFKRYQRFDTTQGGFGLGYSIVKTIIDEYGIKIDIDSEIDKGTKVLLTW